MVRGRKWKEEGGHAVMLRGGPSPSALPTGFPMAQQAAVLNILEGGGHILQSAPDEICGPTLQKCTHTSHKQQGSMDRQPGSPLLGPGCPATPRPFLPQPTSAHLEGVEEVPEGPGVDDVVVCAEEEGHQHAGHTCRDGARGLRSAPNPARAS